MDPTRRLDALRRRPFYLVLILWSIALCAIARNILTPRLLMIDDPLLRAVETDQLASSGTWVWITRFLYLIAIGGSLLLSVWGFLSPKERPHGKTVWIAFLIFACGPAVASVFGEVPGVYPEIFLFPVVVTAFFLNGDVDGSMLAAHIKRVLLVFIYGSILAIPINPLWAVQVPYLTGIFPIPVRLFGLAESPQRMGPLLLLFVIVERMNPTAGRLKHLHWAAWGIVLVLAQEKVALLTSLLFLGLFLIEPARDFLRRNPRAILVSGTALIAATLVGVVALAADPSVLQGITEKGQDLGVDTLTGRTGIWKVTLETWRENPIFGYGPRLWDLAYRLKAGPQFMHVGMAHNQFVQSLGETGLFGLFCLMAAILLIAYYAIRLARATRWSTVALALVILVPTLTEAPFRNYFLGEDFFTTLCVAALLFHAAQFAAISGSRSHG